VILWLLCGLIGAWMTQNDGRLDPGKIAQGPITLVQAFSEAS
jgi:hypothetical protein